jgi:lysozyme
MALGRTRRVAVAVAAVVAAMAIVAIGYRLFRSHRPALEPGERYGIDVSHHQGAIDWEAVAEDGIDFAYLKATEGGDWVDSRYAENEAGASAAGLDVGAYHFFTNCRTGAEQAANFLATADVAALDLPPALDLEFAGQCPDRHDPAELRAEIETFIDIVEAEAQRPVVAYVLDDFDDRYQVRSTIDRPLWERSLFDRPDGAWLIWQYSNLATVDGIDGRVDLDVARPELLTEQ